MGYQLWKSSVTGHRRRGTRLIELRNLLEAGVTAHTIFEPLFSCPSNAPATEMQKLLQDRSFDVAGVRDTESGPVTGYVTSSSLIKGKTVDHLQNIMPDHLISESTSLAGIFSVLKDRAYVFILAGTKITGIVTLADLNKPPVRIYLFGFISLLEMHMSFRVQEAYPEDSWQESLDKKRLEIANKHQSEMHKRRHEINLFECLQFCDKRDLLLKKKELLKKLNMGPEEKATSFLVRAENLRNLLAHSQSDLAMGTSWLDIIELVGWIEQVIHTSDEHLELKTVA